MVYVSYHVLLKCSFNHMVKVIDLYFIKSSLLFLFF